MALNLVDKYEDLTVKLKKKIVIEELTVPLFFILLLQIVGTSFRTYPTICWEKKWEVHFVVVVSRIRAFCDRTIELLDSGKVENPTRTLTKVLSDKNITPVTLSITENEDEVEIFSSEDV
jgi:hypothetical protein